MTNHMVFDVESIGLHGEGFAVAYVVVNDVGARLEEGMFACKPSCARGTVDGHSWVTRNVDLAVVNCHSPGVVRQEFWATYQRWKARPERFLLWADCAWPVEARFLIACIEDGHTEWEWEGPYPLYEIATLALACGLDPTATRERLPDELPVHNPLNDARQSARLLLDFFATLKAMAVQP